MALTFGQSTRNEGARIAAVLTTADLERSTGLPRSTIRFYTRQGLLPPPQKTASGRSLYGQEHVELLDKLTELKHSGLSLAEIRDLLDKDLARAQTTSVDLESQERERVHAAILRVATEEFVAHGYRLTHVASIILKLGINPHVFYSHFPSKLALLVECFNTYLRWNVAHVRPQVMTAEDLGERLLRKVAAESVAGNLGADLTAAIRLQGQTEETDPYRLSEVWADIVRLAVEDLESVRPPGSPPSSVPMELLAHSFIGALRNARTRASWDDKYSTADLYRTHLFIYLAVLAALRGDADIDSLLPRYESLIQDLASRDPDVPPALDDPPTP